MPQYSFSSIASLATSQRKEPPAPSGSNNSYNSGFQQYQPPTQQQQQHIQHNQPQNHLPHQFAHHQPQAQPQNVHQQPQQQPHSQPVHQLISGEPVPTMVGPLSAIPPPKHSPHQPYLLQQQLQPQNDQSTAQQKPTTSTFQPLATSTTAKSTIEFVKPPVNEHDIDPPVAATPNDEKEVVKDEDDKKEVEHKIVTQQPQIHPGKVPPIVISTRKPIQPTISLPKQEQLEEEENEEESNNDNKDDIKEEQIKDAMEIDIIEKNDGQRDVNTMTGHALNQRTMLDGMILTETSGGLLVVNVMYKNKEFFGTLMECASSSHSWGAPRHSDIPAPDKKPKKKKKSKSENRLAPRIGLRNRRRMKRRNKREKRMSWDTNNSPPKSNKRISF